MGRLLISLMALLLTGTVAAGPDGKALYGRHCAACHGADGHGGVGVPLALPDFLANVSDTYLAKTIRHGRPGRVMPAFDNLNEDQLQALIGHIRTWMPEGTARPERDERPVNGDKAHGGALFARHCAECHGAKGEGGPGTGVTFSRPRDLPVIAPALNNTAFLDAATDRMYETYQAPRSAYWVVSGGDGLWGGGGIGPLEGAGSGTCELQKMYFRSALRGRGWGDRLLTLALETAVGFGFEKCYLETMPYMEAARKLYQRHGFLYRDRPMGQTGHTSCTVWMEKELA